MEGGTSDWQSASRFLRATSNRDLVSLSSSSCPLERSGELTFSQTIYSKTISPSTSPALSIIHGSRQPLNRMSCAHLDPFRPSPPPIRKLVEDLRSYLIWFQIYKNQNITHLPPPPPLPSSHTTSLPHLHPPTPEETIPTVPATIIGYPHAVNHNLSSQRDRSLPYLSQSGMHQAPNMNFTPPPMKAYPFIRPTSTFSGPLLPRAPFDRIKTTNRNWDLDAERYIQFEDHVRLP